MKRQLGNLALSVSCIGFTVAAAHGLTTRTLALRGLAVDPISPPFTWIGIAINILIAALVLFALIRGMISIR